MSGGSCYITFIYAAFLDCCSRFEGAQSSSIESSFFLLPASAFHQRTQPLLSKPPFFSSFQAGETELGQNAPLFTSWFTLFPPSCRHIILHPDSSFSSLFDLKLKIRTWQNSNWLQIKDYIQRFNCKLLKLTPPCDISPSHKRLAGTLRLTVLFLPPLFLKSEKLLNTFFFVVVFGKSLIVSRFFLTIISRILGEKCGPRPICSPLTFPNWPQLLAQQEFII